MKFSAPTTANVEITEKCNARCLHCYNPWREESMGVNSHTIETLKKTIDELKKAGVFHLIFTGGEPMSKIEVLYEALSYGKKLGFSFSLNSNLMLTTDAKMKKLAALGLDHVLTSFPSIESNENDRIMQVKNSIDKIQKGIENSVKNKIRVSVNCVITKFNYKNVYSTGKFVANLGVQKLFITRAVPPVYSYETSKKPIISEEYKLTHEEAKSALDQALQVKKETGIMLGTLVNFPVCFLGDLEKYKDFFGRGCPSQRGDRININATGIMHTCVHEETEYGNILKDDLREVYQNKMNKWHDKKQMIYEGCTGCSYIDSCYSGCQMIAIAFNGKFGTKDPLYVGPNAVSKKFLINEEIFKKLEKELENTDLSFEVNPKLRFRKEKDFYLINIQWGNSISINNKISEFIITNLGKTIKVKEIPFDKPTIIFLILKDMIKNKNINIGKELQFQGLSFNFQTLPYFKSSISSSSAL